MRRRRGEGHRPGDSLLRVSSDTRQLLEARRQGGVSFDTIIRELVSTLGVNTARMDLTPEVRAAAEPLLHELRDVPRELALTALAVWYLRTLPEQRRLQLLVMAFELSIESPS